MAETTEQYRARINQLKTSIENEPLIKKMRDDIAEGVSKTGNRQADIEVQFQSVIDGTTGKDVISAPEIIAARNGETNLKTRLDKKEQEVTAQLSKKIGNGVRGSLNDVDGEFLAAIQGGEGTSFNLLSEPAYKSVTVEKTNFFTNEFINYFDKTKATKVNDLAMETNSITVNAGDVIRLYVLYPNQNHRFYIYDSAGVLKKQIDKTSVNSYVEVTLDVGGFLKVVMLNEEVETAMITINHNSILTTYIPYGTYNNNQLNFNDSFSKAIKQVVTSGKWRGKKINGLGDSIFFGIGASSESKKVLTILKELTGSTINNYSVSSSKISNISGDAVLSFVERMTSVDKTADLNIIFGGTNDFWHKSTGIGSENDTDAITFYGALNSLLSYLSTEFVGKKTVFVFPYSQQTNGENTDMNFGKGTFDDFRQAAKNRCERYAIPFLDLYATSGMDIAHNETHLDYFGKGFNRPADDGVHLNDNGNQYLAELLHTFIENI